MAFMVLFEEGPEWTSFLRRVRDSREAGPESSDGDVLTIVARAMGVPTVARYVSGDTEAVVRALLAAEAAVPL